MVRRAALAATLCSALAALEYGGEWSASSDAHTAFRAVLCAWRCLPAMASPGGSAPAQMREALGAAAERCIVLAAEARLQAKAAAQPDALRAELRGWVEDELGDPEDGALRRRLAGFIEDVSRATAQGGLYDL